MNIEIRRVREGDAPILAHIQTESWKAAFAHILDPETLKRCTDPARAEAMYERTLRDGKGIGYLLSLDGAPHCIAWWNAARDAEFAGKAELICIHSLPGNWRKGYGSLLMDRALADIRAAGYKEVVLWVFVENARARAFYEAQGFFPTAHTKLGLGAEEICYARKL